MEKEPSAQLHLLKNTPEQGIRAVIRAYAALSERTVRATLGRIALEEDVEELVSDVFAEVYRRRDSIDLSKGSLATYVVTLSRRKAVDHLRRNGQRLMVTFPLEEDVLSECGSEPQTVAEQQETYMELTNAVASLPEPERTIVFRRFCYGESYKEIGKRLGMRANAVNKRCLKALARLKNELQEGDL